MQQDRLAAMKKVAVIGTGVVDKKKEQKK